MRNLPIHLFREWQDRQRGRMERRPFRPTRKPAPTCGGRDWPHKMLHMKFIGYHRPPTMPDAHPMATHRCPVCGNLNYAT